MDAKELDLARLREAVGRQLRTSPDRDKVEELRAKLQHAYTRTDLVNLLLGAALVHANDKSMDESFLRQYDHVYNELLERGETEFYRPSSPVAMRAWGAGVLHALSKLQQALSRPSERPGATNKTSVPIGVDYMDTTAVDAPTALGRDDA